MSISDVAARLKILVGQDGSLLLDPARFAGLEFAAFHEALASVLVAADLDRLPVSRAQVALSTVVTVDGQAVMFGTKSGAIHLEVTGDDELTVTLAFTAPPGWGFADGFPGLPSSYKHLSANPALVGLGTSALYDLALASATLTATSGSPELAFAGSLADSSQFTFLAAALSLPARPPLTGTIRLNGDAPAVPDLVVGGGNPTLAIGGLLTLTEVGLHAHTVQQDPGTGGALTRVDLDATVEAGTQDPVPVKLSAPFYGLAGMLELTADFGEAGLSVGRGVHAFAELLHLDVGTFALPRPLDVLERLELLSMTCVATVDPPEIDRVVLTVGLGPGQAWTITDGIEVDDLTLGWAIAFPFNSQARSMSGSIAGTLALGTVEPKLEFDVLALSDDGFTASGTLTRPMTLEQIATTVHGTPVTGLPELEVLAASVWASTSGDFGILVNLGNWPVGTVGGTPIVLYEVLASLERTGGAIAAQFLTVLGVGKARLLLLAQLHMSPQAPAGWVFDGGTQPGTSLDIGDLLTELAGTFGITQVPEPIRSLTLKRLNLHYDTAASHFSFSCEADFTVQTSAEEKTEVAVVVSIDVAPTSAAGQAAPAEPAPVTVAGTKGYSATFKGTVKFGQHEFDIAFSASPGTDVLVADYHRLPGDAPASLHELVAQVSPSLAADIPDGIVVDLEEVKFVFLKQTATQWAFGIRLGLSINLNELPVVGSHLPPNETLAVENLQLLYSSADLGPTQTAIINPLLPPGVATLPAEVLPGIAFDADIRLGTVVKHLHTGVTPPGSPALAGPGTPGKPGAPGAPGPPAVAPAPQDPARAPASSADPIEWLNINRQFGVFSFQRVGAGYRDNVLLFALDASVALGPLAFSLQALTVGSRLTSFDPVFSLDGLALEFDRPPITISGGFLRSTDADGGTSYYGELMVGVASFALKAIGGWTPEKNSFFIYVSIDVPLGGTPFLFVTGLAGGFGINRRLVLPSIDEAGTYPLLPGQAPAEQATPAATIATLISTLKDRIPAATGEYWVAAGIRFTSFEMIESLVVVSVEFGVDVQVGVVGVVTMTFPTGAGDEAIAHVEIDLVASFTPSTGLLAVDGRLSPQSFLLGGFVKLTGGFAFRAWFSGPHRGDFLVTLGGYHPSFVKPDNYPAVPRLGLAFALGPLKVTGESYFALTPHAFMAGLRLAATFEAGPIKVWFDAGVDFLFEWAPFHYEADAYVDIGCSVDLGLFTLTLHVGADLQIWGPAFGGTALIDLTIISFSIPFGAPKALPPPIGWDTLAAKFLPADAPKQASRAAPLAAGPQAEGPDGAATAAAGTTVTHVVKADVPTGKLKTDATDGDGRPLDWVVDPDHFRIVTTSVIPANQAEWTTGLDAHQAPVLASLPNDLTAYHRGLPASDGEPADPGPPPGGTAADRSGDPSANPDPPQTGPPQTVPAALADMYLWVEASRPATGPVWYPTLHVAPMGRTDVVSHHVIGLSKIENGIAAYLPPPGLAVRPVCTASNTALWGEKHADSDQPASQAANAARLIMGTLTGLEISPVPQHPDQVSDIPLQELSYQQDLSTGFDYGSPAADTGYTVTSQPGTVTDPSGEKHSTLTIDVHGAAEEHLPNQDYTLSCLTDGWVTEQRAGVLGQLRALGFGTLTPDEVHLETAAGVSLPDWPVITRIGASA